MGYDDNSPMPQGSSGGRIAVPLWKNFYEQLIGENLYSPTSFNFIDESIKSGELVKRNMDIRDGSIGRTPGEYKRVVLFKKDQVPEGEVKKFFKGVGKGTKGFFKRMFN